MSPFEIVMLVCFGFSWPFSIVRSYKSRSTKGKSLPFLLLVEVGYFGGILHKIFYNPDIVMVLYILNAVMVATDICLYLRNRAIMKREGQK